MKPILLFSFLFAVAMIAQPASADYVVKAQYSPGLGVLNGIAYDSATSRVFVHANGSTQVNLFDDAGNSLGAMADPDGAFGRDYSFLTTSATIGGTAVSANSLLVMRDFNGASNARVEVMDKSSGNILAATDLNINPNVHRFVGATYNNDTGTLFALDWVSADIYEFSGNGDLLSVLEINLPTAYGDVEYNAADGLLYTVSSVNPMLRSYDLSGNLVSEFALHPLGIAHLSGLSFDTNTGDIWLSSTSGNIFRIGSSVPEPGSVVLAMCLFPFVMLRRRR